ncbi:MAG: protein-L-isoaspartate(D-aspartate) O-methyltransferase [Candidatus Pacebacteria bacterium]|nr:protein-L-isoaspartate(D-aspartate) O-methyltransferase [Candidatus Paceibacterota bacterium]
MKEQLIQNLIKDGCLKTSPIIEAFQKVDRKDFVPEELKHAAYEDRPLPIGRGQTISQPRVVAFMLELLEPKQGEVVMDVGSGSGWQSALLAHAVGREGKVVAIERIPEIYRIGKDNCEKYGFKNIEFIQGDATIAQKEKGYFDKIIVAAAAKKVPESLKYQLKIGGKMVLPIESSLFLLVKKSEQDYTKKEFPGFLFVPLI